MLKGPAGVPAGVYTRPTRTGVAALTRGPYIVYCNSRKEWKNACKRTKDRRSRLARLEGHRDAQIERAGGPFAFALPLTHLFVMRAIAPGWLPSKDERIMQAFETGNIEPYFLAPGEVLLNRFGKGAYIDEGGRIRSVAPSQPTKPEPKRIITELS